MPLTSNVKPFGLRQITVVPLPSGTAVVLPAAQTLSFSESLISGELRGDDAVQAIAAITDKVEWSLEAGGISFDALKVMTGRTIATTGTTPSQKNTLTIAAGDNMPYFKIYGKVINDDGSDTHCLLHKCKLTGGLEGEFAEGEFYIQSCEGVAISNGTKIAEFVHNESATTVPAS